jgi:hypothetical protein
MTIGGFAEVSRWRHRCWNCFANEVDERPRCGSQRMAAVSAFISSARDGGSLTARGCLAARRSCRIFISGPLVAQEAGTPARRGPMASFRKIMPTIKSPSFHRRVQLQLPAKRRGSGRFASRILFPPTSLVRGAPARRSSSSPPRSDSASSPASAAANMPAACWSPAGSGLLAVDAELAGGSPVLNEIRRAGLRGSHVVATWTHTFPIFNLRSIWPKGG